MSESTFHTTKEDLRKAESKVSKNNDGNVPSQSDVAQLKVHQPGLHYLTPSTVADPPLLSQ